MNKIIYAGKHALTMQVSGHFHNSWELIFCTGGGGELEFEDQVLTYGANDVAVIPPFLPHSNRSEEGFTNIHINLTDTTFSWPGPLIIPADANGFLRDAFNAAFYYYSTASEDSALLLPIYGQLIAAFLSGSQPARAHSETIQAVLNDILHNYPNSGYDLNAYLRSLPFNPEYLKKLFKQEVGMTPLQYLTNRRLENAANILAVQFGEGNVSETARLCGFSDPLYFSRLFRKKYGVPPSRYKPSSDLPQPLDGDSVKTML